VAHVLQVTLLLGALLFGTRAWAQDAPHSQWTAFAYPVSFEHISVQDGLSHSTVHRILQDKQGFLWFGTDAGLNRYDGFRFRVFHPESNNPNSLSGDWILDLMEDHRGYLWIATRNGGVTILDPETMRMLPIRASDDPGGLPSNTVQSLAEDPEGNVWLATETQGVCRVPRSWQMPDKPVFQTFRTAPHAPKGAPTGDVTRLYFDKKGTLWLGSRERGLGRLISKPGDKELSFDYFPFDPAHLDTSAPEVINTIQEDSFGQLWLGGDSGLFTFDPIRSRFQRWNSIAGGGNLGNKRVLAILRDTTGIMWIAGDGAGLLKALPRSSPEDPVHLLQYRHDSTDANSLSGNGLQWVFEDRSGVLWVSAYQGGLNKLVLNPNPTRALNREKPSLLQFRNRPGDALSLSGNTVSTMGEDRFGNLWIGTDGFGLNRVSPVARPGEPMRFERFLADPERGPGSLQSDVILTTHLDRQKQLWFGTFNRGLLRVDQASPDAQPTFTHFVHDPSDSGSLASDFVRSIVDDDAGGFWVALDGAGLNHFDPRTNRAKRYGWGTGPKSSSSSRLYRMVKDSFGTLWIATSDGLNRFNPATEEFRVYKHNGPQSLREDFVNTLYLDDTGSLWIGTRGGGLNQTTVTAWDGPEPQFKAYGTAEGLPSTTIMGILPDNEGNLWLSTERTLCRFDIQEGRGHPLPWQGELRKAEFIWNSCFQSPSGELLFGSNDGLTLFSPQDISSNATVPPIAISGFRILNEPLPLWSRTTQSATDKIVQEITLGPKDTAISFEFAALHFVAPDQNQYAYLMEGLGSSWNRLGNDHSASFTTIPPGDYVLRVKGSNCDNVWNDEGLRLKVHVLPPWHMTWWFRTLLFGLFSAGVYLVVRIRLRALRRHNQMLEEVVLTRTRELAQANEALRDQSLTDPLTGLRNRRFLTACMPEDAALVKRLQRDLSSNDVDRMRLNVDMLLIMGDIDHFKSVNDRHGHLAGDRVLMQMSNILQTAVRASDTVIRWGGEEFLIVARNAARADATIPVERIRAAVESHLFEIGEKQPIRCTCSLGFSVFPFLANDSELLSWEQVVEIADACLYAAKRNGRNACVGIIPDVAGMGEAERRGVPRSVPELIKSQLFPVWTSLDKPIQWDLDKKEEP
jgi:diguanylate cyclase (GGDEF)-like protein